MMLLLSLLLGPVFGMPSEDSRTERVFDITQEDRLNIELAERVGVTHLAVSYPQGINCTLQKSVTEEPWRQCTNVSVPVCRTVQKVRLVNVTEDCSEKKEYCQYNFRTQALTKQTVICQRDPKQVCDEAACEGPDCQTVCEENSIVVCATVPQTVAITEKKQRCGAAKTLVTTKICFTYPDASWVCKEPRESLDCEEEGVRLVAHEVAQPRIECKEQKKEPLCVRQGCRLLTNTTDCLTTDIPTEVRLEDQVCEECQEGRTKLRPALLQEEECDSSSFQEFCQSGVRSSNKWSKVCSLPRDVRDQVLAAVLENTQDGENEIEGKSQDESAGNRRLKESKVVRMKLPAQASHPRAKPTSGLRGVDVFFAKTLLGRQGQPRLEPSKATETEGENLAKTEGLDVSASFQFEARQEPLAPLQRARRPTGMPYVLSDLTTTTTVRPFRPFSFNQRRFNGPRGAITTTTPKAPLPSSEMPDNKPPKQFQAPVKSFPRFGVRPPPQPADREEGEGLGEIFKLLRQSQTPRPESGGYTRSRVYSSFTSNRPTTSKPEASLEAQTVDPTRQSHPMPGTKPPSSILERVLRNRTEGHRLGSFNNHSNTQSPDVPQMNGERVRNPLLASWESLVTTKSSQAITETNNSANNKQKESPSLTLERPLPSSSSEPAAGPIPSSFVNQSVPVPSSRFIEGIVEMTDEDKEDVQAFPVLSWGSPEGRDSSEGDWQGREIEGLPGEDEEEDIPGEDEEEEELEAEGRFVCGFEGEKWLCVDLEEKSQGEDDVGKVCGYEGDKWICLHLDEKVEIKNSKYESPATSSSEERVPRGQAKNPSKDSIKQNQVTNQDKHKLWNNQNGFNYSESMTRASNSQDELDKTFDSNTVTSENKNMFSQSKVDQEAGIAGTKSPVTKDRSEEEYETALQGGAIEEQGGGDENDEKEDKQSIAESTIRKSNGAATNFLVNDTDNEHDNCTENYGRNNKNATNDGNIKTLKVKGEDTNSEKKLGSKSSTEDEEGKVADTGTANKAGVDDHNPDKSGSCVHVTDSSMRIHCKVIACFRNPDNCYS